MPLPFYLRELPQTEDPIDTIKGHLRGAIEEMEAAANLALTLRESAIPASDGKQVITDLITTLEAQKRVLNDFEDDLTEGQRTRRW